MPYKDKDKQRESVRRSYEKNRDHHMAKNREWKNAVRDKYRAYKESVACTDCGIKDHRVIEFDHVAGNKAINISQMRHHSWDAVLAEIAKCEPVCANCHKIRTWERSHQ